MAARDLINQWIGLGTYQSISPTFFRTGQEESLSAFVLESSHASWNDLMNATKCDIHFGLEGQGVSRRIKLILDYRNGDDNLITLNTQNRPLSMTTIEKSGIVKTRKVNRNDAIQFKNKWEFDLLDSVVHGPNDRNFYRRFAAPEDTGTPPRRRLSYVQKFEFGNLGVSMLKTRTANAAGICFHLGLDIPGNGSRPDPTSPDVNVTMEIIYDLNDPSISEFLEYSCPCPPYCEIC